MNNLNLEQQLLQFRVDASNIEVISYYYSFYVDYFKVTMVSEGRKIIVTFMDVAKVVFSSKKIISKITSGDSKDEFFISALREVYVDKPLISGYNLFCFYGNEETPFFKIVARAYSLSVK